MGGINLKKTLLKKLGIPVFVATALIAYATPAFAWSSVSAYATVTFTDYASYYYAKGTGKVSSSGSNTGSQALENYSVFTRDGEVIDSDESREGSSPVTLSFRSDREGDSITWDLSVYGYLYEDGEEIDSDEDYDGETHPGI